MYATCASAPWTEIYCMYTFYAACFHVCTMLVGDCATMVQGIAHVVLKAERCSG